MAGMVTSLVVLLVATRIRREPVQAEMAENEASALSIYWARIEVLEAKVVELQGVNEQLQIENTRLAAEIGRLRMSLDRFQNGG